MEPPDVEQLRGDEAAGRPAQRQRTRAAILAAATRLVSEGHSPSIDDIAIVAEVSRRTVYMHFPTLDQLLLDATLGAMSSAVGDAAVSVDAAGADGPVSRVAALVRALTRTADTTLPLGRRLIRLTVESPAPTGDPTRDPAGDDAGPLRGYRRIDGIEQAVEPLRDTISAEQLDRLVSALSVVIGFEAMVVLRDVRGLAADKEEQVLLWAATSLVEAMLAEADQGT